MQTKRSLLVGPMAIFGLSGVALTIYFLATDTDIGAFATALNDGTVIQTQILSLNSWRITLTGGPTFGPNPATVNVTITPVNDAAVLSADVSDLSETNAAADIASSGQVPWTALTAAIPEIDSKRRETVSSTYQLSCSIVMSSARIAK